MNGRDTTEHRLRTLYRVLLRAYPAAFREAMGTDIEETFVDRLRDARAAGVADVTRFLASAVADAIGSGLHERLAALHWSSPVFYWQDIRYALRLLRKSPALTTLTIAVLGGGLGVTIFTFSFLYTAMVRPIPVSGGDRIVRVTATAGPAAVGLDAADLSRIRGSITTLADVGAFTSRELVAGGEGAGDRRVIDATAAEWNIFQATRTRAALGRTFRPDDAARGAEPVLVLSDRTWRSAFGSDTSLVGRTLMIGNVPTRVIGVMPAGYGFPVAADAWVPLSEDALATTTPGAFAVDLYARLEPGVSMSTARAQLQTLLDDAVRSRPRTAAAGADRRGTGVMTVPNAERVTIHVETFPRAQLGDEGPLMFAVLNLLAVLILLLACVNVVNLLLARANDRAREMAVRLALGASRGRLVVQSLWETAIVTLAGGVLATAIAAWGLSAINAWAQAHIPGNLAFWWVWRLDRPALLAAGGFITLTIAVLGAVVSARATNVRITAVLQDSTVRGGNRRQSRLARALVVTQVATVSVLMFFGVMSGIVARRVTHVDLGFDTRNLMRTAVVPRSDRYETAAKRTAFHLAVRDAVVRSPEVDGATLESTIASLGDASDADRLALDRGSGATRNDTPRAFVRAVLGPLETLGSGLREGRAFDSRDGETGARTAIVSRAFAERYWPRTSALGREVQLAGLGEPDWRIVVGVADDVPLGNPLSRERSRLAVYVPLGQRDVGGASLMFRHRGNAAAGIAAVHRALADVDPAAMPEHVASAEEILETTSLMARSVTKLFVLCFGFALLLAVSGTYGLMAQAIGGRTREIGVRRALGATDAGIVRLLLGQGGRQLGVGAVIALPLLVAVGVGFARFFPIATGLAVTTGVLVAVTIVSVVLAATYLPTRRALRVSPRQALWGD
jgi:predicted permease